MNCLHMIPTGQSIPAGISIIFAISEGGANAVDEGHPLPLSESIQTITARTVPLGEKGENGVMLPI